MKPICKIQYNNFEAGEFTDVKQVDYATAINIIEHFPWEKQREHIVIELTNPSVSFECSPDCILKLALFFNHKFVLHFFDGEHLYTNSFTDYKQAYPFIEYFFQNQTIDFSIFKKENTWMKKIGSHFLTANFVYSVNKKSFWKLLDFSTIIFTALLIFLTIVFIQSNIVLKYPIAGSIFFLVVFMIYGGINYILLLNYYLYSKNKTLQLSKGNDIILWGKNDALKAYKKSDVVRLLIKKNNSSRAPWSEFAISFLFFRDGTYIKIPCIILGDSDLSYKMLPLTPEIKGSFIPFCKQGN
jgi:hypothetical protein